MFRTSWTLLVGGLLIVAGCARPVAPLPDVPLVAPTPAPAVAFPRDAGPHDGLTEWWYYTGHLTSDQDGRTYGFEFVIFQVRRQGAPTGYLAHFAVSDVDGQRFSHQARFSAASAAATTGFPLEVSGWRLDHTGSTDTIQAAMAPEPGASEPFTVSLQLADEKPPALHHGGYIEYGPAGGSYYYSRTRLSVSGQLGLPDGTLASVSGIAWMDHQWGNFVVTAAGGWDWYSLQLDDRSELMLYVLRSATGETTGVYGTRVQADGSVAEVQPRSVSSDIGSVRRDIGGSVGIDILGQWTSPHTGAVYPSGWRLQFADGEQLVVQPQLVDQELWFPSASGAPDVAAAMAYWEGAVSVSGDRTGVGYVELTGYAGSPHR